MGCPAGCPARKPGATLGCRKEAGIRGKSKPPRVPLGAAVEDYLKTVYQLTVGETPVSTSALAVALKVSPAAVTKMSRRLSALRLVHHSRYRGVRLTTAGRRVALEVVRHHRLLELYLNHALGYPLERVHAEAEILEHAISEDFEESIDRLLGHPQVDPHGDPIPTRSGSIPKTLGGMLADAEVGEKLEVCRVRDNDGELLQYLVSLGLVPKTRLEVVEKLPFGGPVKLRVRGTSTEHFVGHEVACSVFVERR